MNDQTSTDTDMQSDDQAPEAKTAPVETATDATMILELESMIKNSLTTVDRNKAELKKHKEMMESVLTNDEGYRESSEKAKEAAKAKGKAKLNVLANPATKQIDEKIKDLAAEIKELNIGLSEYLREYQRLSGSSEIEGDDGEVREIVYVAKLIKKSKRS